MKAGAWRLGATSASGTVRFAVLHAGPAVIEARLLGRLDHLMPRAPSRSQFATLEPPAVDEADVLTPDAELPAHDLALADAFAVGATAGLDAAGIRGPSAGGAARSSP